MEQTVAVLESLNSAWGKRLKLCEKGYKLWDEGNKLWYEGRKLQAEGDMLRAKGYKLCAEGDMFRAEGRKLWAEAILEFCGNIKIDWKNYHKEFNSFECHLGNGMIFKP